MRATAKIVRFELRDVGRSRWLLAYAAFFLIVTDALLRFGGSDARAMLSLMNVVLFIVPLASIVFGTIYIYNAREFTELLLAQPVRRGQLYAGLYLGLTLPLAAASALGITLPFLLHGFDDPGQRGTLVMLVASTIALTGVFVALAVLIAVRADDKMRGLGTAIAVWLFFSLLYDGLVLVATAMLSDYPIERPLLGMMLINPVDLARVMLLLQCDVSALMGYTGAVFQRFFGGSLGTAVAALALTLWIAVPVMLGMRAFQRKDF